MDLDLTTDQELLRNTTRRFVEQECPLPRVRELSDARTSADRDYLASAAELGWFATLVPEDLGGGSVSGLGVCDAALVAEERGRMLQPAAFVPTNVVAHALVLDGTDRMRELIVPELVAGAGLATWAVSHATGDFEPTGGVRVTGTADALRLTGRKTLVQDAHSASWILVTARDGDGASQFLVEADRVGVHVVRRAGFDLSRQLSEVSFDDVEVSTTDIVGGRTTATAAVERQLDLAAVLTVAESVGAMDHLFELTVEYAKARTAFGRPIGSFQAVKHLLADTSLLLEESKAVAVAAAHALQRERDNSSEIASMAKSFVADAGVELAHNCWQVFGGIGYTWEHDFHLYLRRLTLDAVLYGDAAWHRERICRLHGLGES
ncbi:MAG TPA: acyl-CoA dehydrogenase family protein [Acidimicrobiia bacterium]|jgi:alkylation response protein AidB-like acyl-CoA dehydrogenase